jgi:hypothetical protein
VGFWREIEVLMDFVGLDRRKGAEGRQIQNKLVSIINQSRK